MIKHVFLIETVIVIRLRNSHCFFVLEIFETVIKQIQFLYGCYFKNIP